MLKFLNMSWQVENSTIIIINFNNPFAGGIAASEQSLINCLQSKPGASCVLMPGGASEALRSFPQKCNVILKNRRGFIRLAIKTGWILIFILILNYVIGNFIKLMNFFQRIFSTCIFFWWEWNFWPDVWWVVVMAATKAENCLGFSSLSFERQRFFSVLFWFAAT